MTATRPFEPHVDARAEAAHLPLQANGHFDELRDFVDRAASGEIDLELSDESAAPDGGKLPAGWYLEPVEAGKPPLLQRARLSPEIMAGLMGLAAGLVILLPLAYLWQREFTGDLTMPAALVAAAPNETAVSKTVDVVAVKPLPLVATPEHKSSEPRTSEPKSAEPKAEHPAVAEARSFIADGEVLAARAVLAQATAARDPEGMFLMAETYDPNLLAALRARGVGADAERARALYLAAQALGHPRAGARLQALR